MMDTTIAVACSRQICGLLLLIIPVIFSLHLLLMMMVAMIDRR